MVGGYMGKILFVDLSNGEIKEEPLDEKMAKDFLGCYGIGARILYSRMKPGVDPLGPENMLGFVTGPLTGTGVPTGSRYMVVGQIAADRRLGRCQFRRLLRFLSEIFRF